MDRDRDTIAANLKLARARAGLSQSQVGLKLYLDRASISRYENGKRCPEPKILAQFSELYDWADVPPHDEPDPLNYF
jgi:transcriptional regulator with XRE-family HTH domain